VVLNEALDQRAQLPYEQRFLLVGMTATPPTDVPEHTACQRAANPSASSTSPCSTMRWE